MTFLQNRSAFPPLAQLCVAYINLVNSVVD